VALRARDCVAGISSADVVGRAAHPLERVTDQRPRRFPRKLMTWVAHCGYRESPEAPPAAPGTWGDHPPLPSVVAQAAVERQSGGAMRDAMRVLDSATRATACGTKAQPSCGDHARPERHAWPYGRARVCAARFWPCRSRSASAGVRLLRRSRPLPTSDPACRSTIRSLPASRVAIAWQCGTNPRLAVSCNRLPREATEGRGRHR
jgi:hypothetical protein